MKSVLSLLFLSLLCTSVRAQISCGGAAPFEILHFTKTSGFNHGTKVASLTMFEEIGTANNFTVVNSDSEGAFDDLTTLMGYEVIVFANTSGNIPFTAMQQANLESYVASGGGILGIHAATDMYRDASYTFYTDLMGGSRRNSPPHTNNRYAGTMNKVGSHPSTANVPDPWNKEEEYYYWPDTGLVDDIVVVLEVEATGSNSYDAVRPASWYQTFDSGARSFYTTLGHFSSNYNDPNNDFRKHLADALCWLVEAESLSLPLNVIGAGLENDEGLHTIDWRVNGDLPVLVELYGGYDQASATLLKTDNPDAFGGVLNHRPNNETDWFYYRLRFVDEDGLATWSEWLAAAPFKEDAGGGAQVQYGAEGAVLVVPADGPTQAFITDASGRTVGGLQLTPGQNLLPKGPAGVYVIRFPFRVTALRYMVR